MTGAVRIAVAGAGLIGRRHVEAIRAASGAALAAIVDPAPEAEALARNEGVAWFATLEAMMAARAAEAVVLATPNQLHVEQGLACVAAGLPVLVEKPIATDAAGGERLAAAAEAAGVPLLVGHHRRHNPLVQRAREAIEAGAIGRIVSVAAMTWFFKPDDYFEPEWRRRPGAGPVFLNLIHDVDLMQFLCGPVATVHALDSNAVRGHGVEDTAVVALGFESGALGTINASDAVAAPWSWELTARENPAYPPTGQACYWIGGTEGSLEMPGMRLWRYRGERSWWQPIDATQLAFGFDDPLVRQIAHFAAVARGEAAPLVSGRDGLRALRTVEAIKRSAASGGPVAVAQS
jgi:predicted dehydrogenase